MRSVLTALLSVILVFASSAWSQSPAQGAQGASPESGGYIDPDEPLLTSGPLPDGPVSLIGGTVERVDRIHNSLRLKAFAGKSMTLAFDERTSVFRDGEPVTYDRIQPGDRVHVDTMLNQGRIFARDIRIQTRLAPADARGQIVSYDEKTGRMVLQDELAAVPVSFQITKTTRVQAQVKKDGSARAALVPGALVIVLFVPEKEDRATAREVTVLAQPGKSFLFAGTVTNIDLSSGILSLANKSDDRNYDITFVPASTPGIERLKIGAEVTIHAVFDASRYLARQITIHDPQAANQ